MRIPGWERGAPAAVALVWIYEGFWCKVFPGRADQRAVMADLPAWRPAALTAFLHLDDPAGQIRRRRGRAAPHRRARPTGGPGPAAQDRSLLWGAVRVIRL